MGEPEYFQGGEPAEPETRGGTRQISPEEMATLQAQMESQAYAAAFRREAARRQRIMNDLGALVTYCTYGRPEPSEPVRERFRRNESAFLKLISRTQQLPPDGEAHMRLSGLIQEAHEKTAALEAMSPPARGSQKGRRSNPRDASRARRR